ncbi:MAG: TspO/MBR family protein [Gammaproteobacteria bacterium]|nr:TspO/MBR family protein [Gammaproteobacteria bacterium]MDP2347475.1 TspO/MBR family protein [Gammaproteobacteria bacterium]
MNSLTKELPGMAVWFAVTFIAAAIGGAASVNAGTFYAQLTLPVWAPPAWLFGPVWTLLYAMMGIAAWMVWRARGFHGALTLFLVQLVLNALWSWLFFGWQLGGPAFMDIVILWCFIVATMAAFWNVRPLAGAFLIPYLLWVSFALALNYSVWQLNPQILG